MGYIDGKLVVNPTMRQLHDESLLDLTVAGTRDAVLMVEAGVNKLPEDLILEAIMTGHRAMQPIIDAQEKLRKLAGKPKQVSRPAAVDEALKKKLVKRLGKELEAAIFSPDKDKRPRGLHPRAAQDRHRRVRRAGRRSEGASASCSTAWRRTWSAPRSSRTASGPTAAA